MSLTAKDNDVAYLALYKENAEKRKLSQLNAQEKMVASGLWICCLNCINYAPLRGQDSICIKYKLAPPIGVIVKGCVDWDCYDNIPF